MRSAFSTTVLTVLAGTWFWVLSPLATASCPSPQFPVPASITLDDCRLQYHSDDAAKEAYLWWKFPVSTEASTAGALQFEFTAKTSGPFQLSIWAQDSEGNTQYGLGWKTVIVSTSGTHQISVPVTPGIKIIRWGWSFEGAYSADITMARVSNLNRPSCLIPDIEFEAAIQRIKTEWIYNSPNSTIGKLGSSLTCGTDTIARRWAYSALSQELKKSDWHAFWFPTPLVLNAETLVTGKEPDPVDSDCAEFGQISGQHAHLTLPGTGSIANYATCVSTLIEKGRKLHIQNWTIDLSKNRGGALFPMISGIAAFLPDGKILSFTGGSEAPTHLIWKSPVLWAIQGPMKIFKFRLPSKPRRVSASKLSVIIGDRTASSGEALAMVLKAAGATLTGAPTSGRATAIDSITVPEGSLGFSLARMAYPDGSLPKDNRVWPEPSPR